MPDYAGAAAWVCGPDDDSDRRSPRLRRQRMLAWSF